VSAAFVPQAGAVFSADIAVPEHDWEVRFYSQVLSTGGNPLWREADLMNNAGMPVIGLGPMNDEYRNLPLQWMPHIQVPDVARSARFAVELGGTELMHGRDEDGMSQWAVLLDPNGAAFGLIPIVSSDQLPVPGIEPEAGEIGRIAFLDLTVPDAAATRDFYVQVVGWKVQEVELKDGECTYSDYLMLGAAGQGFAGICHARGVNASLPPVWLLYLPVNDITESIRRVEQEGGKVLRASRNKTGEYNYVVVEDPVGAVFALSPG